MLSRYFQIKTESKRFDEHVRALIHDVQGRKVVIYGMGEGFVELNKKYHFNFCMNVAAVSDLRFEKEQTFEGMRAVPPQKIENEDFDLIIVTNESSDRIVDYIKNVLKIDKEIKKLFEQEVTDEIENIEYLESFEFSKHLKKLEKKLKNKKIIIYGTGVFFRAIKYYYNLDGLNIIAVSDKKFKGKEDGDFLGYRAVAPEKIKEWNPDYVFVATKMFVSIIEELYYNYLKGTRVKLKPLMKKDLWTLLGEIWSS